MCLAALSGCSPEQNLELSVIQGLQNVILGSFPKGCFDDTYDQMGNDKKVDNGKEKIMITVII